MRLNNELISVAEDYIFEKGGDICLNNPDTPSFIRRQSDFILSETISKSTKKTEEAPGQITSLLNILFGEDDIKFAY